MGTGPNSPTVLGKLTLAERLSIRYRVTESGCWQWTGYIAPDGYARMSYRKKNVVPHRASYELARGPIPEGLHLDHLCRNRSCINPDHLEPVTPGVNVLRGEGPTAHAARSTECPNGHPYEAGSFRISSRTGLRVCITCDRARSQRGNDKRRHRNG